MNVWREFNYANTMFWKSLSLFMIIYQIVDNYFEYNKIIKTSLNPIDRRYNGLANYANRGIANVFIARRSSSTTVVPNRHTLHMITYRHNIIYFKCFIPTLTWSNPT